MPRHSSALWLLAGALLALPALADDVVLVGVFGSKAAVLAVGGGAPKTVRVGQRLGALTLLSVEGDRATVEVDGKRRVLVRGQTYSTSTANDRQSVTLAAGPGGHFMAEGEVDGGAVRFVIDTGATMVTLPGADAQRLGIDYRKGAIFRTQTANGTASAYRITLDTVRVGGIELHNVDGIVIENGLGIALLGMSFLNRVDMMHQDGRMTLTRRY
ncbi:MAG TPA: TIGR02281 family clan AA aspartic protease [Burkholderiales bacterium]|nr:TIGR02281 family clan AA aspartic protease [Burkholderiales bacterium]